MPQTSSRSKLSRRDFLKLLAAVGATAAGSSVLATYTPWLNYEHAASQPREALALNQPEALRRRELVRYATLAANGHNTQPWKFSIKEDAIEIHPDFTRQLKVVDPDHRELWISLGCALENLTVAARAAGYAPEVTYPDTTDFILVQLTPLLPWAAIYSTLFPGVRTPAPSMAASRSKQPPLISCRRCRSNRT
jgi:hypothetical protein